MHANVWESSVAILRGHMTQREKIICMLNAVALEVAIEVLKDISTSLPIIAAQMYYINYPYERFMGFSRFSWTSKLP